MLPTFIQVLDTSIASVAALRFFRLVYRPLAAMPVLGVILFAKGLVPFPQLAVFVLNAPDLLLQFFNAGMIGHRTTSNECDSCGGSCVSNVLMQPRQSAILEDKWRNQTTKPLAGNS